MKENSIEEAIDRLEYVNRAYNCNNYYSRYDLDCIEILLSDYKRVLKENEQLRTEVNSLLKENEELKVNNYESNNIINDLLDNIPVQKVKDILNEINKEYIKQEERFNKHFEKENRDMQDFYIQKEVINIMQELSWIEGKLQELLEGRE